MNTYAINKIGIAPLKKDLERITAAASIEDLIKLSAEFGTTDASTFFVIICGKMIKIVNKLFFS